MKLQVANPCSESWNEMTLEQKGRFCSSCSKSVVDFTRMNDREVVQFISNNKASTCGRFNHNQLNRNLVHLIQAQNRNSISEYSKLLIGLLAGTLTFSQLQGQTQVPSEATVSVEPDSIITQHQNKIPSASIRTKIVGEVLDKETGEPIPFASVHVLELDIAVNTDVEGKYKLNIPYSYEGDSVTIHVASIGYEKMVSKSPVGLNVIYRSDFLLYSNIQLIGEVTIVRSKKWWQFWKRR